jgi:CDP-glucose 4,6-dehydratase
VAHQAPLEDMALMPIHKYDVCREFWSGRRVLITGHTGFKGGWLVMWLEELGARVSGLGLEPDQPVSLFDSVGLATSCSHRLGDVRSLDVVRDAISLENPEIVFHLAAQALVRRSYREPVETLATNVMGTANVLEACRRCADVRAVLVVTSDKVYENRERLGPYVESEQLGGHDLYSVSKVCAEFVTMGYGRAFPRGRVRRYGVGTARAGNVIGGGDWAEDRIVPDLARAFASGATATIRSPAAVRPWQHVIDIARGYLMFGRALLESPDTCPNSLNFGPSEPPITVGELADRFAKFWGGDPHWQSHSDDAHPYEATLLAIDSTRATDFLGWRTRIPVDRGLRMAADWYRAHAEGADAKTLRSLSLNQIAES